MAKTGGYNKRDGLGLVRLWIIFAEWDAWPLLFGEVGDMSYTSWSLAESNGMLNDAWF